jgi:hypothetical protein
VPIAKQVIASLVEAAPLWTLDAVDVVDVPQRLGPSFVGPPYLQRFVREILDKAGVAVGRTGTPPGPGQLGMFDAYFAGSGITVADKHPLAVEYAGRVILLRLLPNFLEKQYPKGTELDVAIVESRPHFLMLVLAGEHALVRAAVKALRRGVTTALLSAE